MKSTTQISVTVGNHVLDQLGARTPSGKRSSTMTNCMKRYFDLMAWAHRDAIERFQTIQQISATFEVWGNVPVIYGEPDARHHVAIDTSDSWLRHDTSRLAVEGIITAMSLLHVMAMIDLCELFWAGYDAGRYEHPEDLIRVIHPRWNGLLVKSHV